MKMKVESEIKKLEKIRTDTLPIQYRLTIVGEGNYEECKIISDLMLHSKEILDAFKDIWLNSKIYLTKKEIKLIVDANKKQFQLLDPQFVKIVDDNFEDILL